MSKFKKIETLLKPYLCPDKIRVGSKFDGGYVLPHKALLDCDCLLSFGVSTNIDFENEFSELNPNCEIFMYDPFIGPFEDFMRLIKRIINGKPNQVERTILLNTDPNYVPINENLLIQSYKRLLHWNVFYNFISKKSIHYNKLGIRNYCDNKFTNFPTLFSKPELKRKSSIILKIDIEGDEYTTFNDLLSILDNVSVILYEFHEVEKNDYRLSSIIEVLKTNGFYLIHIHGNNSDVLVKDSSIPNTLELSFCNQRYCDNTQIDTSEYPKRDLDYPCNPEKLDYSLEFLKY